MTPKFKLALVFYEIPSPCLSIPTSLPLKPTSLDSPSGEIELAYGIRGWEEEEARLFSSQAASCPMRRRALPMLICSKARSEGEGAGGSDMEERGSANLGRRSDAPQNIGHWPIFFPSLTRKEDLACKNSAADSNTFICHAVGASPAS